MGGTILLADDSITIQKVVELTFGETEHRVVALSSGRELLRRVGELRPDVILCDVVMPDLNGYEVCQTLKADPATLHLPVVLLTGTFEPFDRDRAIASGCDAIVTKPFEGRELITVVEDLLQRARGPHIAEPEPSFFPGFGAPEGMPGLEYSTTGFEHMVPAPQPEPSIPEHGLEISGIGAPPAEVAAEPPAPLEGGDDTRPSAGGEPAEDSWISRIDTEPPHVGSMQGEFFEEPVAAEAGAQVELVVAASEAEDVVPVLEPWEESAELQARTETQEPAPPPVIETAGGCREFSEEDFATGESAFPEPTDGLVQPGGSATWEQLEAAEEPEVGLWPPLPPPEPPPAILPPLTPTRESIASTWDAQAVVEAGPQPFLPEAEVAHPEPGYYPFGDHAAQAETTEAISLATPEAPSDEQLAAETPVPEEAAVAFVDQPVPDAQPEVIEQPEELPVAEPPTVVVPEDESVPEVEPLPEAEAEPVLFAPPEAVAPELPAVPDESPEPPAAPEIAVEPVHLAEPASEPEAVEPVEPEPEPAPEAEQIAPPTEKTQPPLAETVDETPVEEPPITEEPPPIPPLPELPIEPEQPATVTVEGAELPASEPSEELIEQIVERVTARIALPAEIELSEDQLSLVASRAVQLIPPPPPPELPALSYELEEEDIQRVAARILDMLPPPAPAQLPEDAVEAVAQRAAQLLPTPEPPPLVIPESEIDRITQRVLESFAPQESALGDEEVARVAERVALLLPAPAAAPASSAPGELSDAAVEQIARKVIELSQPLIERIAWEVIPDMAEMLVRRRIAELEKDAES